MFIRAGAESHEDKLTEEEEEKKTFTLKIVFPTCGQKWVDFNVVTN